MLRGILDIGVRAASLSYLEDEKPNTLIESFVDFFTQRFILFKNATHILDVKRAIQERPADRPCSMVRGFLITIALSIPRLSQGCRYPTRLPA